MRRTTGWALVLVGAWACGVWPGSERVGPPVAAAADMKDVERARQLVEQADAPFRRASNTDLDIDERRKARQECHKLLKEARDIYNAYLDEHPGEEDAFDGEYSRLAMMLHFIKKQAGIWEFDPRRGHAPEKAPDTSKGDGGGAGGSAGGDGGSAGGSGGAGGAGGTDTPPKGDAGTDAAGPRQIEPDPAELARTAHDQILAYQKQFPGDVAGLHDLCLRFLAEHDDTSLPEFEKIALLAGALADKLNQFYKDTTNEDPDAIEGGDSKDIDRIVRRLAKDVDRGDEASRVRAARLLGETRSGAASIHLMDALKDDSDALRETASKALVTIGGKRTAEILLTSYRNSGRDRDQMTALQVLIDISKKSNVDAEGAVVSIGRFVLSQKESVAGTALDYLATLGAAGGPGLVEALETRVTGKKVEIIEKLGSSGYYPAATRLCDYLVKTDIPKAVEFKTAAQAALRKMGKCAVPFMVPALRSSRSRLWTSALLREITGVSYSTSDLKGWMEWWDANKPAGGCGGFDR